MGFWYESNAGNRHLAGTCRHGALAWILANRLPGASLSDLDVIRLRLDLDDESKAEFPDHGDRGDVSVHRLRDDLEVWQTGPAPDWAPWLPQAFRWAAGGFLVAGLVVAWMRRPDRSRQWRN